MQRVGDWGRFPQLLALKDSRKNIFRTKEKISSPYPRQIKQRPSNISPTTDMLRFINIVLLLCLTALTDAVQCRTSNVPRTLLWGGAGVGKTHWCTQNEGTSCGPEAFRNKGVTSKTICMEHFIDVPGADGISESSTEEIDNWAQANIEALDDILRTVNTTQLRAIMWVVPCTARTPATWLKSTHLLMEIIGNAVPVVALFKTDNDTPCDPRKSPQEFIDLVRDFKIDIRDNGHPIQPQELRGQILHGLSSHRALELGGDLDLA